jgi:hypothetical protein
MFNANFLNKTQLKIKKNYFVGSDPVQYIFSFESDQFHYS